VRYLHLTKCMHAIHILLRVLAKPSVAAVCVVGTFVQSRILLLNNTAATISTTKCSFKTNPKAIAGETQYRSVIINVQEYLHSEIAQI
jgi:hypothetical protein